MTAPDPTPADVIATIPIEWTGDIAHRMMLDHDDAETILGALHAAGYRVVRHDPNLAARLRHWADWNNYERPTSPGGDLNADLRAAAALLDAHDALPGTTTISDTGLGKMDPRNPEDGAS